MVPREKNEPMASDAFRVIAISSGSHPNSAANSRRTLSARGSNSRHRCGTGAVFVYRVSRSIASNTVVGVGLKPAEFR